MENVNFLRKSSKIIHRRQIVKWNMKHKIGDADDYNKTWATHCFRSFCGKFGSSPLLPSSVIGTGGPAEPTCRWWWAFKCSCWRRRSLTDMLWVANSLITSGSILSKSMILRSDPPSAGVVAPSAKSVIGVHSIRLRLPIKHIACNIIRIKLL